MLSNLLKEKAKQVISVIIFINVLVFLFYVFGGVSQKLEDALVQMVTVFDTVFVFVYGFFSVLKIAMRYVNDLTTKYPVINLIIFPFLSVVGGLTYNAFVAIAFPFAYLVLLALFRETKKHSSVDQQRQESKVIPQNTVPATQEQQINVKNAITSVSGINFSDISGMSETKGRLLRAGKAILQKKENDSAVRNGILLHGPAGTGKTYFAKALAGELGLDFIHFNFSQVNSMWVGQTTEKVTQLFKDAISMAPVVLFLDEVDAVFVDRSKVSNADSETARLTSALLPLIEEARDKGVVLVAATNLLDKLDSASIRDGRFDFKIEVGYPDLEARIDILKESLQEHSIDVDSAVVEKIAARWSGFSIPRLKGAVAELADFNDVCSFDNLMSAMRRVQGRKGNSAGNVFLTDLVMNNKQKSKIDSLAWRMTNIEQLENLGGTIPRGVLFYGEPGTGKTVTVKALANSTGWGFLSVSGQDLISNPERIDNLMAEAAELRPCIVFIDEAEDVLAHRAGSFSNLITNKLLSVIDGASEKTPDVIFVAATNHPENLDSAVTRGGRFSEKVLFELPDCLTIKAFIETWFSKKPTAVIGYPFDYDSICLHFQGLSLANIEFALQSALNEAIANNKKIQEVLCSNID